MKGLRMGELDVHSPTDEEASGCEVLVNIAERLIAIAGLDPRNIWAPDDVADLLDIDFGSRARSPKVTEMEGVRDD